MSLPTQTDGAISLRHLGVIRASGTEAASFLHSQLTNDIEHLDGSSVRLAGYCSPKGRLLASFWVIRPTPEEVLLICSADLLAPTLKRLSMFVLRAKCKLTDASAELALQGVVGTTDGTSFGPAEPPKPWGRTEDGEAQWLRLPDVDGRLRMLRLSAAQAAAPEAADPTAALALWSEAEVRSGVPRIVSATSDQFVPQMINFELLGGVDFKKGCYPGQEVVARSQYRGTVKRRAQVFHTDGSAEPGQEIFHSEDPAQPAGMVVNAAGQAVLAEVKLNALEAGRLHLGTADGPILNMVPMPYEVRVEAD